MSYVGEIRRLRGDWTPKNYASRLTVPESRLCIVSDVHIPYHDEEFLAYMLHTCELHSVEAIVWLGDFFDMPLYSSWGVTDLTTKLEREVSIGRGIIELASNVVSRQYWSSGNHEERFFRTAKYQIGMAGLASLCRLSPLLESGTLVVSDNPTLEADEGRWLLVHPAQYSAKPLIIPSALATRFQKNVMSAHTHHWGQGVDETGRYKVVETGGMFKPELHQYIQHKVTSHRAWVQGFWLMLDGVVGGFSRSDMERHA